MRSVIYFPLRYASVILAATMMAAYKEPWWWACVLAGVAILIYPFISPDRLREVRPPYASEVVIESPWVALAVGVGSVIGRMFFP